MSKNGLEMVKPTSVTMGSGTASISANGLVTFTNLWYDMCINGIFSADYSHYFLHCDFGTNGSSSGMTWTFATSGVKNSSANYTWHRLRVNATTESADIGLSQPQVFYPTIGSGSTGRGYFVATIYNPYETTRRTTGRASAFATGPAIEEIVFQYNNTTRFDGLNFYFNASGFDFLSGHIAVYGMRK